LVENRDCFAKGARNDSQSFFTLWLDPLEQVVVGGGAAEDDAVPHAQSAVKVMDGPFRPCWGGGFAAEDLARGGGLQALSEVGELLVSEAAVVAPQAAVEQPGHTGGAVSLAPAQQAGAAAAELGDDLGGGAPGAVPQDGAHAQARWIIRAGLQDLLDRTGFFRRQNEIPFCHGCGSLFSRKIGKAD